MTINTSLSPQTQKQFTPGNALFPYVGNSVSHVVDVVDQPIVLVGSGFPASVIARIQVSADRVSWSDWLIHAQPVVLSSQHSMQWLNLSGHYRLRLINANTTPYTGVAQPTIKFYPATTTHERRWSLVPSEANTTPLAINSVTTELRTNAGVQEFRYVVNGIASDWTAFLDSVTLASLAASQPIQDVQIAQLAGLIASLTGIPVVTAISIEPASGIGTATPVSYLAIVDSALPILEYDWSFYEPSGVFLGSSADANPNIAGVGTVYVRVRNSSGWSVLFGRSVPIGSTVPVVTDIIHNAPASPIPVGTAIIFAEVHAETGVNGWAWVFRIDGVQVATDTITNPTFTTSATGLLRVEVRITNSSGTSVLYGEDVGTVGVGGVSTTNALALGGASLTLNSVELVLP